jgi:hypothetical protein
VERRGGLGIQVCNVAMDIPKQIPIMMDENVPMLSYIIYPTLNTSALHSNFTEREATCHWILSSQQRKLTSNDEYGSYEESWYEAPEDVRMLTYITKAMLPLLLLPSCRQTIIHPVNPSPQSNEAHIYILDKQLGHSEHLRSTPYRRYYATSPKRPSTTTPYSSYNSCP